MRKDAAPTSLGAGWLRNADDGRRLPYQVRWAEEADLEGLHALHRLVVRGLEHPHMFRADSLAFMARQITARGRTVAVLCEGRLVAYAAVSFPGQDPDNLGRDLPLRPDQLDLVADYDGSAVHPGFRGNGLQRLMSQLRNDHALGHGRHHILGTVSPLNPVSLHNFISFGFRVRGLKVKYGGAQRYIIYRDLLRPSCDPRAASGIVEVPMTDLDAQHELLRSGLIGLTVVFDARQPRLRFGRDAGVPSACAA